jgi:hypothetical protein
MFEQQPRTKWPQSIGILVLGYAVYYAFHVKHWDLAANAVGIVFVIWLLLPYRSFLPYSVRKYTREND